MFVIHETAATITLGEACFNGNPFITLIEETRNGVTRRLYKDMAPGEVKNFPWGAKPGLLKRAGYVKSRKGRAGGYVLAKPPAAINVAEVIRVMDGPLAPIDCVSVIAHEACPMEETCGLRWSCIQDRYARRIDRFFAMNPERANAALSHPYFEVRAVAAKYADLFRLSALLTDPDETVRWSVAMRLPLGQLHKLSRDPDREVRIRVASRISPAHLYPMIHDPDYYVRQIVAKRLPTGLLPLMASDPESEVRKVVAARADTTLLPRLARDPDPAVRLVAIERLPTGQLSALRTDPDWRVRYEVTRRLPVTQLGPLLMDEDSEVRQLAQMRRAGNPDILDPICGRG